MLSLLWILALLVVTSARATEEESSRQEFSKKPNILIIFTDDQGYGDVGCYGNKQLKTPNLDKLAADGTRFTSFYSQAVCGPSRSALLTGRYPNRSKGWSMPADEITWAELMQPLGYQTVCIGKWDVSNRKPIIERMPNAQGFDYYFGPLGANDNGTVHFHENNEPAGNTDDMGSLTTLYTNKAINFLTHDRDANRPFILYLSHTMMHTIVDASPNFLGKSKAGLYGDVVEEFDFETGRLLDALDRLGLRNNTLVIYTSDNGPWNQPAYYENKKGHPEGSIFWGSAGPLRAGKGSPYEGGFRVPGIVRWPGKIPAGRVSDAIIATIDFLPTFANLAGFDIPDDRTIDGIDQTNLLLGKSDSGRDSFLYVHTHGNLREATAESVNGIRHGKWKYLKADFESPKYAEVDRKPVPELYNLDTDIGETKNLANAQPDKVQELQALIKKIAPGN
ncbi:MAG: sulfatase [Verrucomicrobiota bacterium]